MERMKAACILLLFPILFTSIPVFAQQLNSTISAFAKADSLFNLRQWKAARNEYQAVLELDEHKKNALAWNRLGITYYNLGDYDKALESYNRSLNAGPTATLKPLLHSRLAKVYAMKKQTDQSITQLQQAVASGYMNLKELDTASEFNALRSTTDFQKIAEQASINAFPCKADAHKREFDFWVGEWDVFVTGTNNRAGHSLIQKASGDCMILENWTSLGPVPHNGKSMNYVNPQTNKWEQLWVGSGGGGNNVTRFYDGEYKEGVMQFSFEMNSPQGKQIGRFRFFNQGPDQVRQLSETSADGGKTWNTNYDFTYKRKK